MPMMPGWFGAVGGMAESYDRDSLQTVMREVYEESGIQFGRVREQGKGGGGGKNYY
jgi:8-oxo-dGTP pyrophosphatase MutT (NUDIX family)